MKQKLSFFLLFFLLCSFKVLGQVQITGKVSSASDKLPIPGASVVVKGSNIGVLTDVDGQYSISAEPNQTLVFSFVGSAAQEIEVGTRTAIDVVLADMEELDAVVVVGYGVMRKSDLTGSVARVDADKLTQISSVDVAKSLQGRVAGVNVVANSGEPGAGSKIRIRGVGTINNSDPLYIVDGFPVSDISHIAPNDIENMEILKDASATAIYGSRGANGVIMVKTKSGGIGRKLVVAANLYMSVSNVGKKIDMLNAHQFASLKTEAYQNAGRVVDPTTQNFFKYVIDNQLEGTYWQNEILRTAISNNYNVNVSGGGKNSSYDIGMTYSKEEGTVKNTFLEKYMIHANNEYQFSEKVKFGLNMFYTTFEKVGNNSDYYSGSITGAIKADPISAAWDNYTNDFGEMYFSLGYNPARVAYENQFKKDSEHRFLANAFMQIDDLLVKGLSFRAQFGERISFGKDRQYLPTYYVNASQQRNKSSLSERRTEIIDWSTTEYFSYNKTLDKHRINMTLGFEAQKFKGTDIFAKVFDVPQDQNMQYIGASTNKTEFQSKGGAWHSALLSTFYRVNYVYDNRYLLTATIRADGSSKFKKKWGYFPSFSAGWNLHEESFFKQSNLKNTFSQIKFRAGWGQVGNQSSAGNHDYVALMNNGYTYVFGDAAVDGVVQQDFANEELFWETAEQYNVGMDVVFLKGKFNATVDYFIRNTNDMILPTPIPLYAGMWRPRTNAGSISNKGLELALNYADTKGDLSYNVGFNIAFINNKITDIGGGDPIYGGDYTKTEKGKELGYYYGLQTDGIFHNKAELDQHVNAKGLPIQPYADLGDVKFIDQDGSGEIDGNDRVNLGSAIPDYTLGLNGGLAFKGFDFNLFFQGSVGSEIVNRMYTTLQTSSLAEFNGSKELLNRWTKDNPNGNIARLHAGDPNQNDRFSDRYVEDGSFLRLKNIQLGYTLPTALSKKIWMSQMRVYVSVDNVFTLTKYTGFDPEIGDLGGDPLQAGVDVANYPTPRVISFGLNLKF